MNAPPTTDTFFSVRDGDLFLELLISPRARKPGVIGIHGERLKVGIAAPPVDGKANAALVQFVADLLRVPKSSVSVVSGETSRLKRVRVAGCDSTALSSLLDSL